MAFDLPKMAGPGPFVNGMVIFDTNTNDGPRPPTERTRIRHTGKIRSDPTRGVGLHHCYVLRNEASTPTDEDHRHRPCITAQEIEFD
jgi:hypothetical protein